MNKSKVKEALAKLESVETMRTDDFNGLKKLLEEAIAPEQSFYKGQMVIGRQDKLYVKGIFLGFSPENGDFFYKIGRGHETVWCNSCKPDPDAVSLPNWIEWSGGEQPVNDDVFVVVETRCGLISGDGAIEYAWSEDDDDGDILRYAVIQKAEFLL